ncbi:MAG: hypothetical protein J0L82_17610 [Deltaproteobacteria bacterium]|nr:hypothetical protein [Deltaproteobacteria bacterium]
MKHLAIASLTIAMTATTACSNWEPSGDAGADTGLISAGPSPAQGTVDGGGGNIAPRRSSEYDVRSAINQAIANCPMDFGNDWQFARKPRVGQLIKDIGERGCALLAEVANSNRITVQSTPCVGFGAHTNSDGSVSSFKKDGTICLSISRIQATPPGELQIQVSALLIHEISHLLGYGEADAETIQSYFVNFNPSSGFRYYTWNSLTRPDSLYGHIPTIEAAKARLELARQNRSYLIDHNFSCLDADGNPYSANDLSEVLKSPAAIAQLQLFTGLYNFHDWYRAVDQFIVVMPNLTWANEEITPRSLNSGVPEFEAKKRMFEEITKKAAKKWIAIYPDNEFRRSPRASVCEEAKISTAFDDYFPIRQELEDQIKQVLMFD